MPEHSLSKRIERNSIPEPNSGCWLWLSNLHHRGYGIIIIRGSNRRAHRVAWEVYRGPIPEGMLVCHKCDVRSCVNPDHLFLGTPKINSADMTAKGRQARGERHGIAKLTNEDVLNIRRDGRTQRQIAKAFGVSQGVVWNIKSRKRWVHVPETTGSAGVFACHSSTEG
jgi:DNA-binding CsgD family transcriptional regulator